MQKQTDARVKGRLGEVRAEQILEEMGFEIIERNFRIPGAEIDLIAREGRFLCFVEVKLRRGTAEAGRSAVTPAKQRRISRAALAFMASRGMMNCQARFDVLEIQGQQANLLRNAFPYQGRAF